MPASCAQRGGHSAAGEFGRREGAGQCAGEPDVPSPSGCHADYDPAIATFDVPADGTSGGGLSTGVLTH
jgi:hypothetical protein